MLQCYSNAIHKQLGVFFLTRMVSTPCRLANLERFTKRQERVSAPQKDMSVIGQWPAIGRTTTGRVDHLGVAESNTKGSSAQIARLTG